MNKRILRVPPEAQGDHLGSYNMIEFHSDFTDTINKLLKSNNINYKLSSMSYGGDDDDWRVLFKIEKGE